MKTLALFFLLLLTALPLNAGTLQVECGTGVSSHAPVVDPSKTPKKKLSNVYVIRVRATAVPNMRGNDYVRARALAESLDPENFVFQSDNVTFVKVNPRTNELVIIVKQEIFFYETVRPEAWGVSSAVELFDHLRRAKVRGAAGLEAEAFYPETLRGHFENHGSNYSDAAEYEDAAVEFARAKHLPCLLMNVPVNGVDRVLKVDIVTGDFLAASQNDERIVTFYRRQRGDQAYYFLRKAVPQALPR